MPKKKTDIEDVTPVYIEPQEQHPSEEKELTNDEKEQIGRFFERARRRKFRPRIAEICKYMKMSKKTLDDIYHDILLKRCGLSNLNRNFIMNSNRASLEELIKSYVFGRYEC